MGDYLRLLTINDRDIPLASLQRAVPYVAIWSVDHPGTLGNYLAIGPELNVLGSVWATIERNPVGPNTFGAEEVAEFIDSLESGGPPSAIRWLSDYLETIRAIYAIRIYPEGIIDHPEAEDAVYAVRSALRDAVGGIGQWDGQGFTNEDDRLIWCDPHMNLHGKKEAAVLNESNRGLDPVRPEPRGPRGVESVPPRRASEETSGSLIWLVASGSESGEWRARGEEGRLSRALHECVAHRRSPSPHPSPRGRGERATAFPHRRAFPAGQRRLPSPSPRRGEGARRADEGVPRAAQANRKAL